MKIPWRDKKRQARMRMFAWKRLCEKLGQRKSTRSIEYRIFREAFDSGYSAAVFIYENEAEIEA